MLKLLLSAESISLDISEFFHFAFTTELFLQNAYNNGTFLRSRTRFFTAAPHYPCGVSLTENKLFLPPF